MAEGTTISDSDSDREQSIQMEIDQDNNCDENTQIVDEMDVVCEDNVDNISTTEIPKKFYFKLTSEEWQECPLIDNKKGDRHLGGKWTDIFLQKIAKRNPLCPIAFKRNRVVKRNSRKKGCAFFSGKAVCNFTGCTQYEMRIKNEPETGSSVKVKVKVSPCTVLHETGILKGRPLKGLNREVVAQEIQKSGPSNVFYNRLGEAAEGAYEAGNTTNFRSKEVMQKISSEINLSDRLHDDVIREVVLMKQIYDDLDEGVETFKGCIQFVSSYPFACHIYDFDQVTLLADSIKNKTAILYFDATGGVISKIPGQSKKLFYYSMLLRGQCAGDPPIPVAEFISNSHATVDVCNFLMRLQRDLHQIRPSAGQPQRIEVDFSWVLIHATLLTFNCEHISNYLDRSWRILCSESDCEQTEKTLIHICSSHVLHKISSQLKTFFKDKQTCKYIMYTVALMINTTTLDELNTLFNFLSILLLSTSPLSHPRFNEAKNTLDKLMKQHPRDNDDEILTQDDDNLAVCDKEDDEILSKQPSKSAFAKHFKLMSKVIQSEMDEVETTDENVFYSPAAQTYLINTYMSVAPIWTGLLIPDVKHDTNSPAENWMKIVKKDIMQNKKKLRPGMFIRKLRTGIKGRIREFRAKMIFKKKLDKSKPKSCKVSKETVEISEEKWGPKKKSSKKKSLFFSPPVVIPQPKRKKGTGKVNVTKKTTDVVKYTANALHWGGKVQLPDGTYYMSNTCPVDNLLMFCYLATEIPYIRDRLEIEAGTTPVIQLLLDIFDLFKAGEWQQGRAKWLVTTQTITTANRNWNVWGGEAERFVEYFATVQKTTRNSKCSKRRCPQPQKVVNSQEILLG